MARPCEIDGCGRDAARRKLCRRHYYRLLRYGDPGGLPPHNRPAGQGNVMWNGYVRKRQNGKSQLEHIQIAEKAMGRPLPQGSQVHHVDTNRGNNRPQNLVVCQDATYHRLLHKRTAALIACGNANWRKCSFCCTYDDPNNLYVRTGNCWHRTCLNNYYRDKRRTSHATISS
jgi:hypothetical protein